MYLAYHIRHTYRAVLSLHNIGEFITGSQVSKKHQRPICREFDTVSAGFTSSRNSKPFLRYCIQRTKKGPFLAPENN